MATYSVFTVDTPALTDLNDSDDYALGTVVLITDEGQITHARWFFPDTTPSGPIVWRCSDLDTLDLLGSHTFAGDGPGWVEEALGTPIDIAPGGRNVLVWIGTPNRYVATTNFFTSGAGSAGVTNGPLTAPASGSDPEGIGNGRFGGDPTSPPAGTISGGNYFADLVFADPPILPNEGTAAFGLELALATTGDAPALPPNEGAAAFGLELALAATGDAPALPPNEGVAEFGLAFTLSGTGETPAVGASGTAAFGLALALAATGDAPALPPNEGAAAFGLVLTLATSGSAPDPDVSEGAADFGLAYTFSGTGFTPVPGQSYGSAAFSLALAVAATGDAPALPPNEGAAAFSLALALASTGDSSFFRCTPVPSFSEVMSS